MSIISLAYRNGNYLVTRSGFTIEKRCFRKDEDFMPEFPDSIDLKISNRCNLGCPYCHENSVSSGKLADLDEIKDKLSCLSGKPIEIAVGGGDLLCDEESRKLITDLSEWLVKNSFITAITVNEGSIKSEEDVRFLSELTDSDHISALGISLRPRKNVSLRYKELMGCISGYWGLDNITVIHIILGTLPLEELDNIVFNPLRYAHNRVLFLGYKQFGRAKDDPLPETIGEYERRIKKNILERRGKSHEYSSYPIFGFDNLAIEQLNLDKAFLNLEFRDIFMGPEFSCSMYIDAVNGEFAETSRSEERVSWGNTDILTYFGHDKNKK